MDKVKSKALTFDDVLLLPRFSDILPSEAITETYLTKNISLKTPLISAAMDTVTESRMGISLAEAGGIGIVHKNNSIEEQSNIVRAVKKYESGIVRDPVTINSTKSISELKQLTNELNISGMPVLDNGELRGIVTSRDFRYADNMESSVSSIMTPLDRLVTVQEGTSQEEDKKLKYENRIEKVLVLDSPIISHLIQKLESSEQNISFSRVDSDTLDNLIKKDEKSISKLDEKQQDKLKGYLEEIIPKDKFTLQLEALDSKTVPFMITQPEFMRRMKDMQSTGGGGMFGSMPEMYNVIAVSYTHLTLPTKRIV